MEIRGEFIGLKEANRALRRLPEFAKPRLRETMDVTAFHVSRDASAKARRRTGALKRGITWQSRPGTLSAVVGVNSKDLFYWKFLEYGTVKAKAYPLFRPAKEANEKDHERRLMQGLEAALGTMERSAGAV